MCIKDRISSYGALEHGQWSTCKYSENVTRDFTMDPFREDKWQHRRRLGLHYSKPSPVSKLTWERINWLYLGAVLLRSDRRIKWRLISHWWLVQARNVTWTWLLEMSLPALHFLNKFRCFKFPLSEDKVPFRAQNSGVQLLYLEVIFL